MNDSTRIADPKRLEAVQASGMMDSPPEAEFDRLARLAAQLLHAPAAFVTVISGDRQYLKSAIESGEATDQAGSSTGLDRSFCQFAIAADAPFIVEDAREHDLVKDNKAVEEGVIAYAGIPLRTHNGESIGALCVVDSKPRHWSSEDIENLRALARGAMQLIDERRPRASTDGGEVAGDAKSLVDCIGHHLRMARDYAALVGGSGALDLDAEAEARARLMQSTADLRKANEEHGPEAAQSQPRLAEAVTRYLEADQRREQIARAFGQGTAELTSLEAAIQQHMDAADALRITAIDHGANI